MILYCLNKKHKTAPDYLISIKFTTHNENIKAYSLSLKPKRKKKDHPLLKSNSKCFHLPVISQTKHNFNNTATKIPYNSNTLVTSSLALKDLNFIIFTKRVLTRDRF